MPAKRREEIEVTVPSRGDEEIETRSGKIKIRDWLAREKARIDESFIKRKRGRLVLMRYL